MNRPTQSKSITRGRCHVLLLPLANRITLFMAFSMLTGGCASTPPPTQRASNADAPAMEARDQADPLAHLWVRYPAVHYLTASGQGANPEHAREDAKSRLAGRIHSQLKAVRISGDDHSDMGSRLVTELSDFKHAALMEVLEPMATADGFVTIASLRRSHAASFLEKDIEVTRERLETWRRQMREAIREEQGRNLMGLCMENPRDLLEELERLRLSLAVIVNDAREYTPSDDVRSVNELQLGARRLLGQMGAVVVLTDDGGAPDAANHLASLVHKSLAGKGIATRMISSTETPPAEGLRVMVTPRFTASQDTFHFFRAGADIRAGLGGSQETLFHVMIDPDQTRGGGVRPEHAIRESMGKLEAILQEALPANLPDPSCGLGR